MYLICNYGKCACVCACVREQAEGPGTVQGRREQTCSVCACVTCALVCVVHTIFCAERFEGEVADSSFISSWLYWCSCFCMGLCEVFFTSSRPFLIDLIILSEMK